MARYAVVKNGTVDNLIVWDGEMELSIPDSELVEATEDAKIGGSWDGNVFTFIEPDPGPDTRTYAEKRKAEYPHLNDLIVALWEGVVEERMAAVTKLEGQRQAVKAKYPKDE
jgi:hypothetical protein